MMNNYVASMNEYVQQNAGNMHDVFATAIVTFLNDFGEDCDVILDFDHPEDAFEFLFTGTNLSLLFDVDGISVVEFDPESGDDAKLRTFPHTGLHGAMHCLLTTVNQAKPNS